MIKLLLIMDIDTAQADYYMNRNSQREQESKNGILAALTQDFTPLSFNFKL